MRVPRLVLCGLMLVTVAGCRPDDVTSARDQLRRGPARSVQFNLRLAVDTIALAEFLPEGDTATLSSGALAIRLQDDSITVGIGDNLEFDNLTFDAFTFSYDQMLETAEVSTGLSLPAPPLGVPRPSAPFLAVMATPDTVRFDTEQGSRVTGATIAAGFIVRTLTNDTDCDAAVSVALTDADGAAVVTFADVGVVQGTTVIDSVSAAGANVNEFVSVDANATFGACIPTGGKVAADFTFRPLTLQSVTLQDVNETFTENYAALASETRIQAIDTVVAAGGSLALTVRNRLPIALTLDLTLQGISIGGVTVVQQFNVPAAAGDGSTVQAVLNIDLTGATIVPSAVLAIAQGTATAPSATLTAAATTNAVAVDGTGSLAVDRLVGVLDPAVTPELTVSVENTQSVGSDAVDFGDFEDAVRDATINDAAFSFAIDNELLTPITLDAYQVGVAITDAGGNPRRDGSNNIVFETDEFGQPLLLTIAQPGQTQLLLPPGGTANVELTTAAPLLDRLVHLLLDDSSVALVGSGSAVVGDGVTLSRIDASDRIVIRLALLVGLDITLPDSGVVFHQTNEIDGLGLDEADAEDMANRLVAASATSGVVNGLPYGVELSIALISGDFGEDVDVFTLPGHVVLPSVVLPAAAVSATTGRVTQPSSDTVEEALTGITSRPLFGERVTVTVRIRIRPPAGSGGRGAVIPSDRVILNARATLAFTTGGTQ